MTTSTHPPRQSEPTRRRFIGLVGGGMVLGVAPLVTGCASGPPAAAVQPWTATADSTDVRRFMLSYSLLAPNPHNRQPWLADLRREGEITLVLDKERLLPETDPYGRQILIGCGAFIELAVIAAAERGYRVRVDAFPDGEPATGELPGGRAVARLVLTRDAGIARDPLFAQIRRRHTNKVAYDPARAVPADQWRALAAVPEAVGLQGGSVVDAAGVQKVRDIARQAYEIEVVTPRTWLESAHLMRIGPTAIEKHRDGISIMGAMPRAMAAIGVFDPFEVPQPGASSLTRVMDRWMPFESVSGFYWMASRGNSRTTQLATGRAYVRTHLVATAAGIDMHPISQALQEFPEMQAQFKALHQVLGFDPASHRVQMLARVGYGVQPGGPSPRRDLSTMLRA